MKKLCIVILLFAVTGNISAQKWLKNIGKALDKVEKVAGQLTRSENGQTQAGLNSGSKPTVFTNGDVKVSTTLPGFTISVDEVKRTGKESGTISLTLTNTSSGDVRLYGINVMKSLTDSHGNDFSGYGKWELKIGNQTIRRYGTDDDYTFPAGQTVNAVWHIYGLPGTATVKTEKVGSFMKTTTSMPSVAIRSFAMEPSIVYQDENTRRHYTLEITGVKIPAYVHIDREGIETEESTDDNRPAVDKKQNGEETPPTPSEDLPHSPKDALTEQWRDYIQPILDRQIAYVELRSDAHYTNEPRGDVGDCVRLTAISLSAAEYERFDGIVFEYVDPELHFKTNKERNIAQYASSYPRKGTRCGIITQIDPAYKKGMIKRTTDGIPFYDFVTNTLTLDKVETVDNNVINGIEMKAIIFSVIDSPTAFGLAYDRAIMKTQTRKTERLLRGLLMAYNKKTGKWEAKGGTKYNPKTQKWETWFLR